MIQCSWRWCNTLNTNNACRRNTDQTSITVYNDANWKVSVIPSGWGGGGGGGTTEIHWSSPYSAEYAFMLLCKYIIRAIILDNDSVRTIKMGIQWNVRGQRAPLCLWIRHKIVICVHNHNICNSLPTSGFLNYDFFSPHVFEAKMV